jgi:diaminohydroxyphosphoribosylaminopyrimidine deaminase/5-amino-6-(5-phosphoribosylamino)uracil reductase
LNVRGVATPRHPLRVVIDSRLAAKGVEIAALANPHGKVDLPVMLAERARRGVNEVHVEGGVKLNGSMVREGCVVAVTAVRLSAFCRSTGI